MKKVLLLSLAYCLFWAGYANAAPANANFLSEQGIIFQLIFDGRALTRGGTQQVHLNRLAPGYHWAEFLLPGSYGRPLSYRTKVFLDGGLETNFLLIARRGYPPMLRKVSAMPIPFPRYEPVPGYEELPGNYPPPAPAPYPGSGGYEPGPAYPNGPAYNSGPASPYPSPYPSPYSMSPREVQDLLQAVQRQSFDDGKLAIIREALRETYLPADEARRLVATLSFDRNRIETAKYLYTRVTDRQNFYRVYEALQFQSSIREVQQFVDSYRP